MRLEWIDTPYSHKHEVNEAGQIRNKDTGKLLSGGLKKGYIQINVYGSAMPLHRLICGAFHGNHRELHVNHIDGNKLNNTPHNLEWCTNEENKQHALDTGLIKRAMISCVDKDGNIKEYDRLVDAIDDLKISRKMIEKSLYGEQKSTHGYMFFHTGKPVPDYSHLALPKNNSRKPVKYKPFGSDKWSKYDGIADAARALGINRKEVSRWCNKLNGSKLGEWKFA